MYHSINSSINIHTYTHFSNMSSQLLLSRVRIGSENWSTWRLHTITINESAGYICIKNHTFILISTQIHTYSSSLYDILCILCMQGDIEIRWNRSYTPVFIRESPIQIYKRQIDHIIENASLRRQENQLQWVNAFRTYIANECPSLLNNLTRPITKTSQIQFKPPSMNVLLLVVGTLGDIIPFIQIASTLLNRGHSCVRLATHSSFQSIIHTSDIRIDFYPLYGDPAEFSSFMSDCNLNGITRMNSNLLNKISSYALMMRKIFDSCWAAFNAPINRLGKAQGDTQPGEVFHAIISNPVAYAHIHIAEKTSVPLHIMFPQPWMQTKAFPHPLFSCLTTSNNTNSTTSNSINNIIPTWSLKNWISYDIIEASIFYALEKEINSFRMVTLHLPPLSSYIKGWDLLHICNIPFTGLYSPLLRPIPKDWPKNSKIVGAVSLANNSSCNWSIEQTSVLKTVLNASELPLVYVGFGSILLSESDVHKLIVLLDNAAFSTKVRFILQISQQYAEIFLEKCTSTCIQIPTITAYSTINSNLFSTSKILLLTSNIPHSVLFKCVVGAIHHGGSGTTHSSLACALPTMIIPHFADQFAWGESVFTLQCGPKPLPLVEHTPSTFTFGVRMLLRSSCKNAAVSVAAVLNRSNASELAVDHWEECLPLTKMICSLSLLTSQPTIATIFCTQCCLYLSQKSYNSTHIYHNNHNCSSYSCSSNTVQSIQYTNYAENILNNQQLSLIPRLVELALTITKDAKSSLVPLFNIIESNSSSVTLFHNAVAFSNVLLTASDSILQSIRPGGLGGLGVPSSSSICLLQESISIIQDDYSEILAANSNYLRQSEVISDWIPIIDGILPTISIFDGKQLVVTQDDYQFSSSSGECEEHKSTRNDGEEQISELTAYVSAFNIVHQIRQVLQKQGVFAHSNDFDMLTKEDITALTQAMRKSITNTHALPDGAQDFCMANRVSSGSTGEERGMKFAFLLNVLSIGLYLNNTSDC